MSTFTPPNELLLEAQARVCTGPHQTRPLGAKSNDPIQPTQVLDCILQSLSGKSSSQHRASTAQMGAFFTAMSIRRLFEHKTGWNEAEKQAFELQRTSLEQTLTPELLFLWEPERGYPIHDDASEQLTSSLKKILAGQHLGYQETRDLLQTIFHPSCPEAFRAAVLIGQRMNIEDDQEVRAYLDVVFPPSRIVDLQAPSITHFGEPYNGATRFSRSRLFVAALRASLGRPSVLHGVETLPPKFGVTEEQLLQQLGARTDISLPQAAALIQNPKIGFAYVSQREFSPLAYQMRGIRHHIKKRPPFATTEKAQQLFRCSEFNAMAVGFYHIGYEQKLLDIMWERGIDAGIAIKGQEGSAMISLRNNAPSTEQQRTVNFMQGYRTQNGKRSDFQQDFDPKELGFTYPNNPRAEDPTPKGLLKVGLDALCGNDSPESDRIILSSAITDHLLGFVEDPQEAIDEAKEAMHSGRALQHLTRYVEASHQHH